MELKTSYSEKRLKDNSIEIHIENPKTNWKEWIKTADIVTVPIKVEENLDGAAFILSEEDVKAHPTAGKLSDSR